ncbi:helix-turn-helix domain-containing protein [Burkholderia multivorans]|uniref:TrmB family transcriptional regulator n=1 Tax=Burkholderia multivorans TaxID=87883 RepID=UPI000D33E21F|nr:helix-turn-helix domain-containing protein [Burkholderia multivorans]MBR8017365.1 TrmB family transcriptional regulator [Burkholderia multivorans]MEB2513799.1 helix-turn-helix domain-containing protein [Burkholderia multivorans]MEB2525487.1 helix-turn-helix domain-containing protein [Burkholderia multivorans]MEB2577277.1 helix-turn-helix domain-containing protein [Burkholderia multivorans]MEB2595208.1 helix-turn-helix domain-containing protein [Burkholderia multivorans]
MTTNISDDLIQALIRVGFSQYESQAYCALLRRSPLNGHEAGKLSGVPPSKIYETLQRLEAKGAVLLHRSEPVLYAAVPYSEVLSRIRSTVAKDLDLIEKELTRLPSAREPGLVWSLRDKGAIVEAFRGAIERAKTSLFAAVWDAELPMLRDDLERAFKRGVDVHVAIYGAETLDGPRCYDLRECGASAQKRLEGRRLSVVVADEQNAVTAEFGSISIDEAVITNNTVISLLAVEYVKADVMGRILINSMGKEAFEAAYESSDMRALLGLI